MKEVTVVIPIYKEQLSDLELRSLQQAYTLLKSYPITIVKPQSLDLSSLLQQFPLLTVKAFDDDYFKGIAGYNRLMLSPLFYRAFLDYRYLLIYQLDAWVFRDELQQWCEKGYDYIGAPWLEKPVYRLPVVSAYMWLLHRFHTMRGKNSKQTLYNKVGNGGFSLRRVQAHLEAIERYEPLIRHFLSQPLNHFYYEDVFWATQVKEFRYPDASEALLFSFDKYPHYCYQLTDGHLPFGCHAWYKRKMKQFWQPIIRF